MQCKALCLDYSHVNFDENTLYMVVFLFIFQTQFSGSRRNILSDVILRSAIQ